MRRTPHPRNRADMQIVLVNDDGVHAGGIRALARALSAEHEVIVIAPDRERSATSHSITLDRPVTIREVHLDDLPNVRCYAINGTPVDCVHVAGALTNVHPDLLISGINNGANLGGDVSYSGTVHAALEASISGFPALALSQRIAPHEQRVDAMERFAGAAEMVAELVDSISLSALDGIIYNINFPANVQECPRNMVVCPQGISVYSSVFQKQSDPFGREVYWLYAVENSGEYNNIHKTDVYWSNQGYVTCTPMTWNATAFSSMEKTVRAFSDFRFS